MSRVIKFQYLWKRGDSVAAAAYDMDEIEQGCAIAPMSNGRYWECIARRQFTGMLDKNGKEIYEGDILIGAVAISKRHMLVKFADDVASFVIIDEIYGAVTINQEKIDSFELAVSGNIHQNPELIGDK